MARKILHLDLDAFFCSVEELLNPDLKGKAFAVGGRPDKRGVVASCSYAARFYGIHSAMPTARALQLYPQLLLISGRHGVYGDYSERVMQILRDKSPLIEQISIDEAFVDISDLPQSGQTIARELQSQIDSEIGLPCSIGVAQNKLVAKIANDYGKSLRRSQVAPRAIIVVEPGQEAAFLAPMDVRMLWGIGPKSSERLYSLGIKTIGDIAKMPISELKIIFGRLAPEIHEHALGIDNTPLSAERQVKSISNEITFENDILDDAQLHQILYNLSEKVAYRLRKAGLAGNSIHIKIRYSNFSTTTHQIHTPQFTDQECDIYKAAAALLEKHKRHGEKVRLLGVGVSGLAKPARQLNLWDDEILKTMKLSEAVDALKDRYGKQIIQRASKLNTKK